MGQLNYVNCSELYMDLIGTNCEGILIYVDQKYIYLIPLFLLAKPSLAWISKILIIRKRNETNTKLITAATYLVMQQT